MSKCLTLSLACSHVHHSDMNSFHGKIHWNMNWFLLQALNNWTHQCIQWRLDFWCLQWWEHCFLMALSRPVEVPVKLMYSSWNAVHQGDDAPAFDFSAVDPESLPQMEDLIGFKCIVLSHASHTSHGTRFELVTRRFSVLHQLSYPAKASLQVSSPTSSSTLLLTLISIYRVLVRIMVVTCSWPQVQNKFKWFNLSAISSCYKTRR